MTGARPKLEQAARAVRLLARAGLLRPVRPDRLVGMVLALRRHGVSLAGAYAIQAARQPEQLALVDPLGEVTFASIEATTSAVANGLAGLGIGTGDRVAVLARNHRGFVEATVALAKLGVDTLYLNTGFAGPQMVEVLEREGATAIILDSEFADLAGPLPPAWPVVFSTGVGSSASPEAGLPAATSALASSPAGLAAVSAAASSAAPGDASSAPGRCSATLCELASKGLGFLATPADLRAAPGTAGRPPPGTVVRLLGNDDRPVGPMERGRIFVGNSMLFSGYTDRATKPVLDGLMATGDTGYFDRARVAVRRGPGRRHDRVGRRQRLSERGGRPASARRRRPNAEVP